ncbi:hypothetical protein JOD52_002080 [Brachybacterium muris]|nr:hypothetical protein [Brachybacterium muris]
MNTPKVNWVTRLSRNPPSTRGVNWLLASCRITMVIEKTRLVIEIMPVAMVPSSPRAPSGPPWNT